MIESLRRSSAASETDSLKPSQSVAFGHVEEVEFEKRSRVSNSQTVIIKLQVIKISLTYQYLMSTDDTITWDCLVVSALHCCKGYHIPP